MEFLDQIWKIEIESLNLNLNLNLKEFVKYDYLIYEEELKNLKFQFFVENYYFRHLV